MVHTVAQDDTFLGTGSHLNMYTSDTSVGRTQPGVTPMSRGGNVKQTTTRCWGSRIAAMHGVASAGWEL